MTRFWDMGLSYYKVCTIDTIETRSGELFWESVFRQESPSLDFFNAKTYFRFGH